MVEEVKTMMKMTGITYVALIYTALVSLTYLATDGFRKSAALVFTFPVVALGLLTLRTRMPLQKRIFTSVSFLLLAVALYEWSQRPRQLELNMALICASHVAYLATFVSGVRRFWRALAALTTLFVGVFTWALFGDLYRSLPSVVALCCTTSVIIAFSFVAAGSVWKTSHGAPSADSAALARFVGIFLMLLCDVALLSNQFARHTHRLTWYLNLTYYTSQYLMYFANERAF